MSLKSNPDFWDAVKYLFTNPPVFFELIRNESFLNSFIVLSVSTIIFAFLGYSINFFSSYFYSGFGSALFYPLFFSFSSFFGSGIIYSIVYLIFIIAVSFVGAAIYHISAIILGSKEGYMQSYKLYAYSYSPFIVLSSIPVIGLLSIFYSFYLTYVGYRTLHNLPTGRAVAAAIVPPGLFLAILIVLFYIAFFYLFTYLH